MLQIVWPQLEFGFHDGSRRWVFRKIVDAPDMEKVVEIANQERDFLGGSVLKWLLGSCSLQERMRDLDLALYGVFDGATLAGCCVLRAFQADLVTEAAFCCVHRDFREHGLFTELTLGAAIVSDHTNARLMYGDAVSHHQKSQRVFENAGFFPVGILPDFELFGSGASTDALSYVRYVRFAQGDASRWLERMKLAKLNPTSQKFLQIIREYVEKSSSQSNVVEFPMRMAKAG